jgi:hypothetical protein
MKKIILLVAFIFITINCYSLSNDEIEEVLGSFIGQNTFDSDDFDTWVELYSIARQTLLRRLALSDWNETYYNVVTMMINPRIVIYAYKNENTVIGGNTSKIVIYISYYERGVYSYFLVKGTNIDDPDIWYNSYVHEILFTKNQQRGWASIRTNLTDIKNEINADFLTIIRPRLLSEINDNRIRPWNILDNFFSAR